MLAYLLLLFIIVPFVELALLMKITDYVQSWQFTFGLVVVTGVVGAFLARLSGKQTFRRIQAELAEGRMPTESLVDALMIFVAGALLMTPGILTDLFGFSLLVPLCRRAYRSWLRRWFKARFRFDSLTPGSPGQDTIIDSYVVDRRDSEPPGGA